MSITATLLGIVIVSKLVQWLKAELPILVTPSGIVTRVNPTHSRNVEPAILVTPLGIVISANFKQNVVFTTDYYSIFYRQ